MKPMVKADHCFLRGHLVVQYVRLHVEDDRQAISADIEVAGSAVVEKAVRMRFPRDIAANWTLSIELVQGLVDDNDARGRDELPEGIGEAPRQLKNIGAKVAVQGNEAVLWRVPFRTVLRGRGGRGEGRGMGHLEGLIDARHRATDEVETSEENALHLFLR